jgi:hypothetical protein
MKGLMIITLALICSSNYAQQGYTAGQDIEVYDPIEKNWFPSSILKADGKRYYIHYKGYDPKWDVWVDESRMRRRGETKETPLFYLVGSTEGLYTYYVKEKADVRYLTPDSAAITLGGDNYSFLRKPGQDFLTGKQKIYESNLYLEWVDQNSFLISRSHDNLSYYHRDKEAGTRFMRSPELAQRVDSALAHIRIMESGAAGRAAKSKADTEFATVTSFMSTLKSKRTDPVLTEDVKNWWTSAAPCCPVMKIYFANADYSVNRNQLGIILHNYIRVIIAYKNTATSKCYVKWFTMGYENMGGSTYSKELNRWNMADVTLVMNGMTVNPGQEYAVDLAAIKP